MPRITNKKPARSAITAPRAILPIKAQQGVLLRELVRSKIAANGRERLTQFCSVESIASIPKRAEPLRSVSLTDDGAGTDNFTSLAPRVARGTEVIQSSKGRWQFLYLRKGALAGGLTGAIDIEDDPSRSLSVHQIACLPLFGERAAEQIIEKQAA